MSEQDSLTTEIKSKCAEAYRFYDQADYEQALRIFYSAWLLLPKPQSQYPQSGWVLAAIGDCYYRMQKFEQAQEALDSACHCPDMADNPFIQLRLGQIQLDTGSLGRARKHLNKAFQLGGEKAFQAEHPRYRECIEDQIA